jgi:hypothetical protein
MNMSLGIAGQIAAGATRTAAAVGFEAAARVRGARALHPKGSVLTGTVVRRGLRPTVGVPWLDEPGEDRVLLRFSRATGVPAPLPDVLGLAIRVPGPHDRPQDLLLTTTGRRRLLRHVLIPHRSTGSVTSPLALGGYTSIVPFRTASGPLMVGAFPAPDGAYSLEAATPGGQWRPFGWLAPDADPRAVTDEETPFDPVLNPVPGLVMPTPLARLRAAAYAGSRRGRDVETTQS